MDDSIRRKRKEVWESSLRLSGSCNFLESAIKELSDYFSKPPEEIKEILPKSEKLLAEEWRKIEINPKNLYSVTNFYNKTQVEIFELMDWHVNRSFDGPLNYVCALEISKNMGFNKYLDYGSGIGSGALIFLKNGFNVTCADIADPLLTFIKFRLRIRNLSATLIDLKKNNLNKNYYDIITCFDVLEHSIKPYQIIRNLRSALREGGMLILNNTDCAKNEEKPMHISQVKIEKRLRCLGFEQMWGLQIDFKRTTNNYVIVLKKINRTIFINWLFFLYDNIRPVWLANMIKSVRIKIKLCQKLV